MTEQWMSMRTAARRLGVSPNKISRLASKGRIKTRENPLDERVRLVDYNELKALFESAPHVVTDKAVADDEGTTKDTGSAVQHPASDPLQ
jgi:hypothetical protein